MFLLKQKVPKFVKIVQNTRAFCTQVAYTENNRHHRIDWHINSKPLPQEQDPIENKNVIRIPNGKDRAKLDHYFYIRPFTLFGRLCFQVADKKKKILFTVTTFNTVHFL